MDLKSTIRTIPDFPKEGIMFRDITTLLKNGPALRECIDIFFQRYKDKAIDKVCAIESRGFIIGGALAYKLECGFVPIRKQGKLPAETLKKTYELEYGTDTLEIHTDAVDKGEKVVLIDDLLATGGTARACMEMLTQMGAEIVEIAFIIDLVDLKGKDKLTNYPVFAIMEFEGE